MDGGLVERARAGDADAFDELARSRIDQVYRTALAILGSPADARDATQDTLVSMWRGLPSLKSVDAFDGWLHRITVNACNMALRRSKGVREVVLDTNSEPAADSPAPSDSTFNDAFDRLKIDQRAILVAHHLDGRQHRQPRDAHGHQLKERSSRACTTRGWRSTRKCAGCPNERHGRRRAARGTRTSRVRSTAARMTATTFFERRDRRQSLGRDARSHRACSVGSRRPRPSSS